MAQCNPLKINGWNGCSRELWLYFWSFITGSTACWLNCPQGMESEGTGRNCNIHMIHKIKAANVFPNTLSSVFILLALPCLSLLFVYLKEFQQLFPEPENVCFAVLLFCFFPPWNHARDINKMLPKNNLAYDGIMTANIIPDSIPESPATPVEVSQLEDDVKIHSLVVSLTNLK